MQYELHFDGSEEFDKVSDAVVKAYQRLYPGSEITCNDNGLVKRSEEPNRALATIGRGGCATFWGSEAEDAIGMAEAALAGNATVDLSNKLNYPVSFGRQMGPYGMLRLGRNLAFRILGSYGVSAKASPYSSSYGNGVVVSCNVPKNAEDGKPPEYVEMLAFDVFPDGVNCNLGWKGRGGVIVGALEVFGFDVVQKRNGKPVDNWTA